MAKTAIQRLQEVPLVLRKGVRPEEFALIVGWGRSKVYEALRDGRIRAVKVGRRYIIPVDEIDRFLAVK